MKIQLILASLLAAQLLLAAAMAWNKGAAGGADEAQPLLTFAAAEVDRVEIDDQSDQAMLGRIGGMDGQWVLPQMRNLAADQSRIEDLLANLEQLEAGWPVAATSASASRFEVAEDNYQRRLRLYAADELLGEYYFGTSPGFRQTHGRRAGEDEVYALAINNFDLPAEDGDWLDKTLLQVKEVDRIAGPDFAISRDEDGAWRLEGEEGQEAGPQDDLQQDAASLNEENLGAGSLEDGQVGDSPLDQDEVAGLEGAFSNLRVLRVAEDYPPDAQAQSVAVQRGDQSWRYDFFAEEDDFYVKRDDLEAVFAIGRATYQNIAEIDLAALLGAGDEDGAEAVAPDAPE